MQPLNPFLRAFFRSTLPGQCYPAQNHVLLVPSTDVLIDARDRESNASYVDLSASEEFLASHVLRVPGGVPPGASGKDTSFRESRGKTKQYSTANGRTVIIKDAFVYGNKGFKSQSQAQLLHDVIYHPDSFDTQAWLVYYISRPLIGAYEPMPITPALPSAFPRPPRTEPATAATTGARSLLRKREVQSFSELLSMFPMIARQMQPGLERLLKEFGKTFDKPLPLTSSSRPVSLSSRRSSSASSASLPFSLRSGLSKRSGKMPSTLQIYDDEDDMRRSLESVVTAAIDLFQMVDKQQLSDVGATTDLNGPLVERMVERYVCEQAHEAILFPRICNARRDEDLELESRVRQMQDLDISQVGIPIGNGLIARLELTARLSRGVEMLKNMSCARSPREMLDVLLATQKSLTTSESVMGARSEKQDDKLTINADTLVSLLLVVIIRSSIGNLHARLSYMRHFIFIDDVESGEMGYALSTFEAVLTYLASDSHGFRKASKMNRQMWQAAKKGDVASLRALLEPGEAAAVEDAVDEGQGATANAMVTFVGSKRSERRAAPIYRGNVDGWMAHGDDSKSQSMNHMPNGTASGSLAHVFPFQRAPSPLSGQRPNVRKRVSMQPRSNSSSSTISFMSRSDNATSTHSGPDGAGTVETFAHTHDRTGQSVLMIAIENGQKGSLGYLLSLQDLYPSDYILADCNISGTTLLSAAVQQPDSAAVNMLLDYLTQHTHGERPLAEYIARQDCQGRCVGHYLFNQPLLIPRIEHLIPWTLKDKNGQTPLFALCRSYDHQEYRSMVEAAISAAAGAQVDGQALHLDDHIDNKGNTLLHIINDPHLAMKLLYSCDSDVNATNDKNFTPLMVASKYGRTDLVRVLFGDPRTDIHIRDTRGLTAVELAKDDEVRNRIDDLVLLSSPSGPDGRITTVVRSFFVEDGTIRMVLKSGAPNGTGAVTVTTCRRSLGDFENLAKWLAQENPASWIPSVAGFATPFLVPSRPSRAVLRDIQWRLDSFFKTLLLHPTFATHEMVWEFFLMPEMDPNLLAERSRRKAETRSERVKDEYTPLLDVREVELFVQHARDSVRGLHHSAKSVLRRTNKVRAATSDLVEAARLCSAALATVESLPAGHKAAHERYTRTLDQQIDSAPLTAFYYSMLAISSTIHAILAALGRPTTLIAAMTHTQKQIDRHSLSMQRNSRWPLGLLDDTRHRFQCEAAERVDRSAAELEGLAKELRHTQQTVAAELAAWQDARISQGRRACRELARRMVIVERARLESMRRAVRGLGLVERNQADARKRKRTRDL